MLRLSLFTSFLLLSGLFSLTSGAQIINLRGSLAVQGGESFTYELQVRDSAGYLKGVGLTYARQDKNVKASLTGYLDRIDSTLTFRETAIQSNDGFESEAIICLLTATLRYRRDESDAYTLSGPISSSDLASASCARGTLFFSGKTVDSLFRKNVPVATAAANRPALPAAATAPVKVVVRYDTARLQPATPTPPAQRITAGTEKEIAWRGNTIELDIWDGGRPDGDIVTVLCNGKAWLTQYHIKAERKHLSIPFPADTDIAKLSILAVNEGSEPPNTADILLTDGDLSYPVVAYNNVGREAKITLRATR